MKTIVFWDFDGTLVYSEHLWSSSVYEALTSTDSNTNVTFQNIREYMAYGFTWHTPNKDYSDMINEKWWNFMNAHIYSSYIHLGVSENIAKRAVYKVRNLIKRPKNYNLYNDTIKTLSTLKNKGITNVILSNNYPELEEIVDKLNISQYFDDIIVSAKEGYDKPRCELFEIAKNKYPDGKYYMIGDNLNADIIGGNNAGMTTILVHKGYSDKACYCFDDLYSIAEMVD